VNKVEVKEKEEKKCLFVEACRLSCHAFSEVNETKKKKRAIFCSTEKKGF